MGGKTRKELEKDLQNQELQFDLEEESKLNDYDAFVDEKDNSIHENIDTVMRKYDRESNTRVWVGKPKTVISVILAAFSLWCIYVTLFATFLDKTYIFYGNDNPYGISYLPGEEGNSEGKLYAMVRHSYDVGWISGILLLHI